MENVLLLYLLNINFQWNEVPMRSIWQPSEVQVCGARGIFKDEKLHGKGF